MLSEGRERLEELAARVGLGGLPVPVLIAALALAGAALAWAALRWMPPAGPELVEKPAAAAPEHPGGPGARRSAEPTRAAQVAVHVVGAVRRAGVYRLPSGSRAQDAVEAAGGALGNADLAGLNLARVLADGEQLVVPVEGEAAPPGASSSPRSAGGASPGGKVDINRASAEDLDALPGVGPSTAAKIVQEREANGPYRSVEDLMRVPGIGPKKLDALKDLVTAG